MPGGNVTCAHSCAQPEGTQLGTVSQPQITVARQKCVRIRQVQASKVPRPRCSKTRSFAPLLRMSNTLLLRAARSMQRTHPSDEEHRAPAPAFRRRTHALLRPASQRCRPRARCTPGREGASPKGAHDRSGRDAERSRTRSLPSRKRPKRGALTRMKIASFARSSSSETAHM